MRFAPFLRALLLGASCVHLAACDRSTPPKKNTEDHSTGDSTQGSAIAVRPQPPTRFEASPLPGRVREKEEGALEGFDPRLRKYAQTAQSDLRLALEQISKEIPRKEQDIVRADLLVFLCRKSLDPLTIIIAQIRDNDSRARTLARIAKEWAGSDRDPMELFQFAKANLGPENRNIVLENCISAKIEQRDFEVSAALIDEMPFSSSRLGVISRFVSSWSESALGPALRWVERLPEPEDRNKALAGLAPAIADQMGLEGITRTMESLTAETAKAAYFHAASELLKREDGAAAVEWLKKLPQADQGEAARYLLSSIRRDALTDVAQYALKLPDPRARENAIGEVTQRMVRDDPRVAANWVMQLPSDVKVNGIRSLVWQWYNSDSEGLSAWISSLPRSKDHDIALSSLADRLRTVDRERAAELVTQIQDSKIRDDAKRGF